MRELVEYLVKNLVDRPDEVEVRELGGEQAVLVEIKVAEADVGKVIGREGRIIEAIRSLARAAAGRQGKRVVVEVVR